MNDNDMANFKIRLDEERPDDILNDEVKEASGSSSNRKFFILFILLTVFVIGGLGAVYMDLTKRLNDNIHAGTTVVSNISKDFSESLAALTDTQKTYEDKVNSALNNLDKTISGINEQLKKSEASVNRLKKSKSDKKEISTVVAGMEKKIDLVQAALDDLKSGIASLAENVEKEAAETRSNISSQAKKLETMSRDLVDLGVSKVDKKTYEEFVKNGHDRYADSLGKLAKEVEFIRYKIKIIEERLPAPINGSESPAGESISEQTID